MNVLIPIYYFQQPKHRTFWPETSVAAGNVRGNFTKICQPTERSFDLHFNCRLWKGIKHTFPKSKNEKDANFFQFSPSLLSYNLLTGVPLTVAGRSAIKQWKLLLPWLHVRCRRPWNPKRVYERTPLGYMPTCSVIASGFSLWMPLDDGFQDSIWNVAVLMASIQKDMLVIRVALVPIVHPIIAYTPTTKARNLSKFTKWDEKYNLWKDQLWTWTHVHQCTIALRFFQDL